MVDVYIVVYSLLGILICLPALLIALNLLMPTITSRIETRLEQTPGKSFFLGVPVTAVFLLWIAITANIPGPGQGSAFLAGFIGMGLGTLGAAGMSRLLAKRVTLLANPSSQALNLLRGAVMYELACLFPIVGWFLFAPIVGITVMGAATFGLLGWLPRPTVREQVVVTSQQ
jgi:Na+/melibiose symporter-like transporter